MVGQCRRRGGRGLVGVGTRVGAAQTYRFWTGLGVGLGGWGAEMTLTLTLHLTLALALGL